jgi:hypothetical protein
MRISKKRTVVALIATAAAVTALGAGTAQGQASPDKNELAATHGTADAAFLARESAASKSVVSTAASRTALATVQTRIAKYVGAHGTKYTFGSWSDPRTGAVVVDTNAPASLVSSMTSFAGNASLASVKVQARKQTISDTYNRRDDIPNYYGGGGILAAGALCSTGYAVQNSAGTRFMVTAGHCYANGQSVNTESNLRQVGVVQNRLLASLGNGPVDMELLGGQGYWGRIFTGGVTSSTSLPVVGAGTAYVGYNNYCHSGRTTGEQCGHTATSISGQVCTQTGCKSPVIVYTGGTIQQGGDSGGTFYAKDSSSIWVRGHVIASDSTTGYVEPFTQVQSRYGISIVNG